jgi:hypothetical protein
MVLHGFLKILLVMHFFFLPSFFGNIKFDRSINGLLSKLTKEDAEFLKNAIDFLRKKKKVINSAFTHIYSNKKY